MKFRIVVGLVVGGLILFGVGRFSFDDGVAAERDTATAATSAPKVDLLSLQLNDVDGNPHRLDEWRGKVVLLNFWASWCPSCQSEIPDLVRYQEAHGAQGFQIVSVGIDEARKLKNAARTLEINYPVLQSDPERSGALLSAWGDNRQILPYSVVVGRDGTVVHHQIGTVDDRVFDMFIVPLLSQTETH